MHLKPNLSSLPGLKNQAEQLHFFKEREEEIGDLAAGLILDFILEKIAPEFYNQGVYDSHKYMGDAIEDLLSIQK